MKIIDIAKCVNNVDPKGIGRIRFRAYGFTSGDIEKSMEYEDWDKNDQFVAIPFLPPHINVIPQINQSVKLIKYDTDKDTQNVEYIVGPFASPHDFGSETFTSQHKNTTYGGVITKELPDVRDASGNYIDKKSAGSIANLPDNGFYGNYGSDLIFTNNGLMLRGGKLVSKDTPNVKTGKRLKEVPILSDKMSKLSLKKFTKTMSLVEEKVTSSKLTVGKIKYVVEYEIDSLTTPTVLKIYTYKVLNNYGQMFNTNVFDESSEMDMSDTKMYQLITTPTGTTTQTISVSTIQSAYIEMRTFLHTIDQKGLHEIDPSYPVEDIHSFFFRPTKSFRGLIPTNNTEKTNKTSFLNGVQIRGTSTGSALIFSREFANSPTNSTTKIEKNLKVNEEKGEQTFGALTADIIYFLSTDTNIGPLYKPINFGDISQYEYTQEDYLNKIDPLTYAFVRGEVLINILKLLYKYSTGHVHNINEPGIYYEEIETELKRMIDSMETELINQSIRIN